MKIHFIAIGGAAMHNLAIALHLKGYEVSGSDDQIFDPSRTRLSNYGILPEQDGWDASKISNDLDAVILGMHAREDNPELAKAQALGLNIYSYPEYIYNQTKDKNRVVIGGSHGKTTITSMILHVLNFHNIENDYMVGAQLDGFECMVKLTEDAPVAILEGDEYLSSPIDRRPKFHLYKPNVALISGIAWDHINVFPTFENYVEQFRKFIQQIEPGGSLIYCKSDKVLKDLVSEFDTLNAVGYDTHPYRLENGISILQTDQKEYPIQVFGDHNIQNLNGAKLVCEAIGVSSAAFYEAIQSFGGAARRLQLVAENQFTKVYKDFAHSPSKLKATTTAVKNQFPERQLIACMELHTFSSLNKTFLDEYDGSMAMADRAIVYFNPDTLKHKKLAAISVDEVSQAFGGSNIEIYTSSKDVVNALKDIDWHNKNLLLMTSGNFGGLNLDEFGSSLLL